MNIDFTLKRKHDGGKKNRLGDKINIDVPSKTKTNTPKPSGINVHNIVQYYCTVHTSLIWLDVELTSSAYFLAMLNCSFSSSSPKTWSVLTLIRTEYTCTYKM